MLVSVIYINMLYGWHLWDTESNIKRSFYKGIKIKRSKKDYQDLIDNFPEGVLIIQSSSDNKVTFIN